MLAHSQTQIEVRLKSPMTVSGTEVTGIRLAADDPAAFVAAAHSRGPSRSDTSSGAANRS